MDLVTLAELRFQIETNNKIIKWAGLTSSGDFIVKVLCPNGATEDYKCDPMSWKPDTRTDSFLSFVEVDNDSKEIASSSPPDSTQFSKSRRAAVFGVNIGGDCKSGACKKFNVIDQCTASYDIETSMEGARPGGFDFVDAEILSIACKCSCGIEFYAHSKIMTTSSDLVSLFLEFLINHQPLWLIGWNCYSFDNECMRYHCRRALREVFMVTRIGIFGKPSYGSILNVPGIYNVDLLVYMSKSLYKLPSFKLGDVAIALGTTKKTAMPEMTEDVDQEVLREYNMNDCVVTLGIWKKEKLEQIIPSLAVCTSSPIYDCCRYVTGTLASLGYSSYVMGLGSLVLWSECTMPQSYSGGYVMEPIKGLHEHIVVCDFSSMYPTIMASCNINPHDFKVEHVNHPVPSGTVEVSKHITTVWLPDQIVTFDNRKESVMSGFMKYLMKERAVHKKLTPPYAMSLKVFANSVYGSLGYDKSHIYSPSCAAAITAVGRHCVKMAADYLMEEGLTILYGDTDSNMVNGGGSKEEVMEKVHRGLSKLHSYFSSTALHMMKMEVEEYYRKGIMMDKKRYCMLREDGSVKNVGISLARRDVSGLCKTAAEVSIDAIFKDTRQETVDAISRFIGAVSQMAVQRSFTLSDVSKYVKQDGQPSYVYPGEHGKVTVPAEEAKLDSVVRCDNTKVLETVASEIERFTIPCMVGKVPNILSSASIDSW